MWRECVSVMWFFFFQAEDGIRDKLVTGVQTCALPIYAIRVPSGDQRALEPFTRNRFFEPSAFMIHSAESHRSSILFTQRRVYTICNPLGEICGSETCSQSR